MGLVRGHLFSDLQILIVDCTQKLVSHEIILSKAHIYEYLISSVVSNNACDSLLAWATLYKLERGTSTARNMLQLSHVE